MFHKPEMFSTGYDSVEENLEMGAYLREENPTEIIHEIFESISNIKRIKDLS